MIKKQKGFIQGALLIGVVLLAIIIGAIAMASGGETSDISQEKVRVNALVVQKQATDIVEAAMIKVAAGAALSGLSIEDIPSPPRPPFVLKPATMDAAEYKWDIQSNWTVNGTDSVVAILPVSEDACKYFNDGISCSQ